MFYVQNFWLFIISSLILLLIPGPAVLYILTRSVEQGRRAGLISVLGIELGNLVLVLGTALGLAAIILSSEFTFIVVKYLGAAYLVYLGIRRILSKNENSTVLIEQKNLSHIFSQGIIVAVLNPKTALFFLAYLPQFVNDSKGLVWEQLLFLGMTFVLLGFISDGSYAILAGTVGNWLKKQNVWIKRQRYISGGTYLLLGAIAAFTGNGQH